jgi:Tol biopolymer transport system component
VIFMVNQGIWQVNADGTGLHEVFAATGTSGVDDGPTFTPDGAHIVFVRCCPKGFGYSLWRINTDGTGLKDLTIELQRNGDGPADTTPQVAPDGQHIAFNRCFPDQPCEIATVDINGNHLRELTGHLDTGTPNWSPDSSKIVFKVRPAGGTGNVATIDADGSHFTQLTFNMSQKDASNDPCYSPDGTKILFVHRPSTGGKDLFTMHPDGSEVTQVTKTPGSETTPQWAVAA